MPEGYDKEKPYNPLPMLPPAIDIESKVILKKAISANKVLAELKGMGDRIPHQGILINSIILQEARVSSEIENIVTTQDELYQAGIQGELKGSADAKEVLYYREALWEGFQAVQDRPLTINTIVNIAKIVKQTDIDVRTIPGTKIANSKGEIIYTPPEGEEIIREKLKNLEEFMHEEDNIDPLIKMAIIHYQFEAIHPFSDGNGRTGRILNILYLIENNLLSVPVLYLSGYIIENKNDYYSGLRLVTENAGWESWILFMLDAIEVTASQTKERIEQISVLMEECAEYVRENASAVYSKDLIEIIFRHPYSKIKTLEDAGIAKRETASRYLHKLVDIGVLELSKVGRDNYFINTRLMELLR